MAASSSTVELCTLADADLDAATSSKFFRADDGPGGAISSFSWPEAGRTSSRLFDQSAVQALCEEYKVPADYIPMSLDGRWMACQTPPEDTIFVYADALEAGMRIPLHDFYVEVLGHYGLAPSQLEPDAWRCLAAFVMLSQVAGVEPSLPAFRSSFSICTHDGGSVGWHHFRSRPGSCLFNGKVPRSPDPEWKSRFFLLRSPPTRPWPCAVKWGKPSRAAVRMPVVTGDTDMVMKKLQDSVMLILSRRSLRVAPPPQVGQVGATGAAAGPPQQPPPPPPPPPQQPPPPPPPPPPQEPTRKRKSCSDTHTLVGCIEEASELAKKAMAELDEQGKELLASRGEVAQLQEALSTANAGHAAEVRRLADEHVEEVKAECAAVVANLQKQSTLLAEHLKKQHAAAVTRLKEEHAAAVSQLAERLKNEHAAAVARLKADHASSVDRLREKHAADVARVKDAADKEVRDTKKKIVLRLFPKLDVTLLERQKLKGDLAAATGTPRGEGRC